MSFNDRSMTVYVVNVSSLKIVGMKMFHRDGVCVKTFLKWFRAHWCYCYLQRLCGVPSVASSIIKNHKSVTVITHTHTVQSCSLLVFTGENKEILIIWQKSVWKIYFSLALIHRDCSWFEQSGQIFLWHT